jgi:tetratricopeptide (TPR) repeat protein
MRALLRVFVANDFEGAEADLTEVLAKRPGDRWGRYRLAQAKLRNGVGWIRTADAISSGSRRAQGVASIKAAIELLSDLVADHPDFVYARLLRGEAWFSLDDEVGAKADYQQVRAQAPDLKEVYLREAVLHRLVYVKGGSPENLHAGIRILGQALQLDPNYFDALFEVGNMYHLLYDRPEAGNASRRTSFSQAILAYRRAMAVNPRAREPRQEWARICLKAGRDAVNIGELRAAHELLLQVAKDASDIAELHKDRLRLNLHGDFCRATGMSMQDAYQQAFAALEALGRLVPDDPELPGLRSLYQRRLGGNYMISWIRQTDPAKKERAKQLAVEALRRAVELAPDDPENAAVRVRLRQLAPELIELDRKRAEKVYEEAVAHFDAGRYEESIPGFREAHLLFPEAIELEYMYGLSLSRAKRLDAAQEVLQKVANSKDSAQFPRALFVLGKICIVKKSPVAARAWFERYLEVMKEQDRLDDPGVAAAREALAELAEEK